MEANQKRLIEIIENMPQNLTDMQKARYIYLEVCKFFVYNPSYIVGDEQTKKILFDEDIDINKIMDNTAICSTLSRALIYLFQQCNIECNGVYFNGRNDGHMEVAFKVDQKVYEADPVRDLMNVKIGYETNGFAKQMRNNRRENFEGYASLSNEELKSIDKSLGYTFGLSKKYLEAITDRGEVREDYDIQLYMDEAVEEISRELYDYEKFQAYIETINPGVNLAALSTQELDKYRIDFLMNYANSFANEFSYLDKKDFFESLISRTMECRDDCPKLFSGTTGEGELITIMKYDGDVAEEDLFYLIREGQSIKKIETADVQSMIDDGFKTLGTDKEKFLISHNKPFQKTTYDAMRKINDYIYNHEDLETTVEKEDEMFSYMLLQRLNKAIADYMEAVHNSPVIQNFEANPIIQDISEVFYDEIQNHGYDEYIEKDDIKDEKNGIEHLFHNMQVIKNVLEHESVQIIEMLEEYKLELKKEAIENQVSLYHVSTTAPEQMKDGEIKPTYNKSQYHQNFGKMVYASTEALESNTYLMARVNGNGMYRIPLEKNFYLLQGNNVSIVKDADGQAKVISPIPGYIYYLPIDTFEPVVHVKYDNERDEYVVEFENEWISKEPMRIPEKVAKNIAKCGMSKYDADKEKNSTEVYAVEQYTDVTSVLEHNQIIIDSGLDRHEIQYVTQDVGGKVNIRGMLLNMLSEKKVRYLNGEADINVIRGAKNIYDGPVIKYDANRIINGPSNISSSEIRNQQVRIIDFVKNAVKSGVTYGEYSEIMSHDISKPDGLEYDDINYENK